MAELYRKNFKHVLGMLSDQIKSWKRLFGVFLVYLSLIGSSPVSAQESPWFIGLSTHSSNVNLNTLMFVGDVFFNQLITNVTDGEVSSDLLLSNLHYVNMKDNGELVDFKRNNPYGVTSYDLFNDIEVGLKAGWQGAQSPIGAYVYGAYGLNKYKLRFLGEREYSKHKLQNIRLGVGVRISPLRFLLDEYDWCPIIELGSTYVNNFKYKGPYGNDKGQINNGMRTTYGIGVQFGEDDEITLMLSMDMAHYDIFNRNYTPDGGFWYPYANFKNKDMNFGVRISFNGFFYD